MRLPAPRAVGDHCTLQCMPKPWTETGFTRFMIIKIFMKWRGDYVFNSSFYRVSGESCAQPLSKARHTTPITSWMAAQLPDSRLNHDSAQVRPCQRWIVSSASDKG